MIDNLVMPQSANMEKSVLSALFQDPEEVMERLLELGISEDEFYHPSHRLIFKQLSKMLKTGAVFDLLTYIQIATDEKTLEQMGGASGITEVYTYVSTTQALEQHAAVLIDRSLRRSVIKAANQILNSAYDTSGETTAVQMANESERLLMASKEDRVAEQHCFTVNDMLKAALPRYEEGLNNPESDKFGIKTGFPTFDYMSGGLKGGYLYVIAARPSMGKTSWMMNIIEEITLMGKIPSDFYSSEMNADSVIDRSVASNSRVNVRDLMKGAITKHMMSSIARTFKEFKDAPLTVFDQAQPKASEVRARTRRRVSKNGVQAVFVDYLQIMGAEERIERSDLRILCMNALIELKALAKECNIPVVVLAQLSREADGRPASEHRTGMIKDCGNIEQDADLIATIGHTDAGPQMDDPIDLKEINILKQRNGPTGTFAVKFQKECTRFYE